MNLCISDFDSDRIFWLLCVERAGSQWIMRIIFSMLIRFQSVDGVDYYWKNPFWPRQPMTVWRNRYTHNSFCNKNHKNIRLFKYSVYVTMRCMDSWFLRKARFLWKHCYLLAISAIIILSEIFSIVLLLGLGCLCVTLSFGMIAWTLISLTNLLDVAFFLEKRSRRNHQKYSKICWFFRFNAIAITTARYVSFCRSKYWIWYIWCVWQWRVFALTHFE